MSIDPCVPGVWKHFTIKVLASVKHPSHQFQMALSSNIRSLVRNRGTKIGRIQGCCKKEEERFCRKYSSIEIAIH